MDSSSRPSDNEHNRAQPPAPTQPLAEIQKRARRIDSSELFADFHEVQIEHAGETYRLRKTRAGKLILTK